MSDLTLPSRRYTCLQCGSKGRRGNQPEQRLQEPLCPCCKRNQSKIDYYLQMYPQLKPKPNEAFQELAADFEELSLALIQRTIELLDAIVSRDALAAAAQAVVDRWETPLWKDSEPTATFINALRNTLPKQP